MTSVVICETFGGFSLSDEGVAMLRSLGWGEGERDYAHTTMERDDPRLVEVVRTLGTKSSGRYSNCAIVEVPDGLAWHIHEYDGYETVHEDHRSWSSDGLTDCT